MGLALHTGLLVGLLTAVLDFKAVVKARRTKVVRRKIRRVAVVDFWWPPSPPCFWLWPLLWVLPLAVVLVLLRR